MKTLQTETKHTPGSWQVINDEGSFSEIYIEGERWSKGQSVAVCRATNDKERETARANARLIASAPDLLAACKAALNGLYSYRDIDGNCSAMSERDQLQTAIEKAERGLL